jgi:hypothetical protein
MAFLAAAPQRDLPLVVLSPMANWVLTKRLKLDRSATDTALTAAKERAREASSLSFQMAVRVVLAVEGHHPVDGLARKAQEISSGSNHRHFEHRGPGARVCVACRRDKVGVGKESWNWRSLTRDSDALAHADAGERTEVREA